MEDFFKHHFTKRSFKSFENYLFAIKSEMRSFSVLGFSDLYNFSYDKQDYFIRLAKWNEYDVNRTRIQTDIQRVMKDSGSFNVVIDDSAQRKFTSRLYYAAKSYIGNLGKVDNATVAVYSCLTNGKDIIPVDFREYLPKSYVGTRVLQGEFRSKLEHAISLIMQTVFLCKELNVKLGYILFDAWYTASWILNKLDTGGLKYVTEVRQTRNVKLDGKKIKAQDLVKVKGLKLQVVNHQGKKYEACSVITTLTDLEHQVKLFVIKGKFCGHRQTRYFVTNDLDMDVIKLIEQSSMRWDIDHFFKEIKTYLTLADAKYHKLRCYRRHYYLCFIAWSQVQQIKKEVGIKTTFRAVRWLRKKLA